MLQTVNNSEKVLNECKTLFTTKLDEILKKMAHLNVRDLPARIQSHSTAHEVQVKAKLGGLPYDRIRDLMAMDTLLIDLNLAISLVSFFFQKPCYSISKFVKNKYFFKYRLDFSSINSKRQRMSNSSSRKCTAAFLLMLLATNYSGEARPNRTTNVQEFQTCSTSCPYSQVRYFLPLTIK